MGDREGRIDAFLADTDWADAERQTLVGDASARQYLRLIRSIDSAILMDAPPGTCGSQEGFIRISEELRERGLSTPIIFAQDLDLGLILMEDLGDLIFSRLIDHDHGLEKPLYAAATDALSHLQQTSAPSDLIRYGPESMAAAIRLTWTHYLKQDGAASDAWLAVERDLAAILSEHETTAPVLVHRDYHAENLLWLPDRKGVSRLGVLDFQDAVLGHPAYDLASLLQDARRDVPQDVEDDMIARFARNRRFPEPAFRAAYAVQATQRHLRILGIFARLAAERGKPRYLKMMPRVWRDLQRNLEHPALNTLRDRLQPILPEPTR